MVGEIGGFLVVASKDHGMVSTLNVDGWECLCLPKKFKKEKTASLPLGDTSQHNPTMYCMVSMSCTNSLVPHNIYIYIFFGRIKE